MTQPGIERRRAHRADVDLPIQLSPDDKAAQARLINISTSGICCHFSEALQEMTLIGIDLQLPGQETSAVQGAVVRCDKKRGVSPPTYEVGIFFTEMSSETRTAIQDFVGKQMVKG